MDKLQTLWHSTGLFHMSGGQLVMLLVCLVLFWWPAGEYSSCGLGGVCY